MMLIGRQKTPAFLLISSILNQPFDPNITSTRISPIATDTLSADQHHYLIT
jgi:hypothetical protein